MLSSKRIQRKIGRFTVGVFAFGIIAFCWLAIVSTLTGCEPANPKLIQAMDGGAYNPLVGPAPNRGKIIDQYDLQLGRKAFLIEVDIPFQNETCANGCSHRDGNIYRVYQTNFLRALHAQIALTVGMIESQCAIEAIAITNARGIIGDPTGFTLPSGAYVIIKCPEHTSAPE